MTGKRMSRLAGPLAAVFASNNNWAFSSISTCCVSIHPGFNSKSETHQRSPFMTRNFWVRPLKTEMFVSPGLRTRDFWTYFDVLVKLLKWTTRTRGALKIRSTLFYRFMFDQSKITIGWCSIRVFSIFNWATKQTNSSVSPQVHFLRRSPRPSLLVSSDKSG